MPLTLLSLFKTTSDCSNTALDFMSHANKKILNRDWFSGKLYKKRGILSNFLQMLIKKPEE
jgi:hypothetical protein